MAHAGFPGAVELRERAPERRVEEDRVVAEAVRPARLRGDLPLNDPPRLKQQGVSSRDGDMADESCRASRDAALAKELLDFSELRRVIRAVPACRVHAGGVVERIDLEP